MKNTLSTALFIGSLALGNGQALAGNKDIGQPPQASTETTLMMTKEMVMSTLNKSESEQVYKKKVKEVVTQALAKIPELELSEDEKQKMITILERSDFQDELYSLLKKNNWSVNNVVLSLLLGFLYGWAYFFTIRKIRDKGMPIDAKSFAIFGGTSGMMAVLNGFVPGSLVYMESFVLALASVYLHIQNKRHGVPYEDGLFERFAQNIPLPVVRYSKDGLPLVWNKQMEDETGYSSSEVTDYYEKNGDIMNLLYKEENLEKVQQYLEQIETSGKGYMNIAFTMTIKSGEEKIFLWTTLPDGNGGTMRIAKHLTDAGEIHVELEKTRELLRKDTLTGIYNRKALKEDLQNLLSNQKRKTDPTNMVMVMMDIDNFKRFNDSYGHESGDLVLKKFSGFIQANLREGDRFYRLGGDEFVLLLESDNFEGVVQKLGKVRHNFFTKEIITKNRIMISGVGSSWGAIKFNTGLYPHEDTTDAVIENLQSQIDEHMYAVKYCGLIEEELVNKAKVGKGQLDKNGIAMPMYDAEKNITGVKIFNEHGSFILTREEIQLIQERKINPLATRRS